MKRKFSKAKKRVNNGLKAIFKPSQLYIYPKSAYFGHDLSFSQNGEDLMLKSFLGKKMKEKRKGFYVDVGAHHPTRFSNTYYFYIKGWNGINLDPIPGIMQSFNDVRSRDINLEIGISEVRQNLYYYRFNDNAYNTFSKEVVETKRLPYLDSKIVETYPLVEILDKYLPNEQKIDFLNIDVEGLDYEVLISNNWSKYRPYIILIEVLNTPSITETMNSKIALYLKKKGYTMIGKTKNTIFFQDNINFN